MDGFPMKYSTPKQVFDRVKEHLLTQNERALMGSECRYRGESKKHPGKTTSCAVGCLITDDLYNYNLEGLSVSTKGISIRLLQSLFFSGVDVNNPFIISLLSNLQTIHDSYEPEKWELKLHDMEITEKRYCGKHWDEPYVTPAFPTPDDESCIF
jgi:hypothetical protein